MSQHRRPKARPRTDQHGAAAGEIENEVAPAPDPARTWYIYLLECADGTLYTGIATDPERRLQQHNKGRGARYTRSRLPVRLIGWREVGDRVEAMKLEIKLKQQDRAHKRAFFVASPCRSSS